MKTLDFQNYIKQLAAKQDSVPIVFGSAGLGLIQSLGERGIKSVVVDDGPLQYRDLSRYCRRINVNKISSNDRNALDILEIISAYAKQYSGKLPIIFPTSDYVLDYIVDHYHQLSQLAIIVSKGVSSLMVS